MWGDIRVAQGQANEDFIMFLIMFLLEGSSLSVFVRWLEPLKLHSSRPRKAPQVISAAAHGTRFTPVVPAVSSQVEERNAGSPLLLDVAATDSSNEANEIRRIGLKEHRSCISEVASIGLAGVGAPYRALHGLPIGKCFGLPIDALQGADLEVTALLPAVALQCAVRALALADAN
eukprot:Skav226105  [mRNA]  locus=scaffold702:14583:20405:+ [translate_table: standard]